MAEFGIPDEPGFRGAPTLGPLASSVAGFTQGLQRGLQSRQEKKAALAKQQAEEKVARTRAQGAAGRRLDLDFEGINETTDERSKNLGRELSDLRDNISDPLLAESKESNQAELARKTEQLKTLQGSSDAVRKAQATAKALPPQLRIQVSENILEFTRFKLWNKFEDMEKFIETRTRGMDPRVKNILTELGFASLDRGDWQIIGDQAPPGEIELSPADVQWVDNFFEDEGK